MNENKTRFSPKLFPEHVFEKRVFCLSSDIAFTGRFRENGKFWKGGDYRIVEMKCRIFIMRNLKIIILFSRELLATIQVLRLFCPAV